MKINEIIKKGIDELKENNIEEPILKMRILVANIINKNKEYITTHGEDVLDEDSKKEILSGIDKLKKHLPIQYITKNQEFMKLKFYVNENVLIPRSDTEILVEEVINTYKNEKVKILDLCTGSGCIAISLKKYIPNAIVYASDISKPALNVAKINSTNNNVEIKFICSDMFKNIGKNRFDVIVSNPPYIKRKIINTLDEEVKNEPIIALDGGNDGLNFYREIIKQSYEYLTQNGMIFLEIGYDQKEELIELIREAKRYEFIKAKRDLGNNDRIVVIRKV